MDAYSAPGEPRSGFDAVQVRKHPVVLAGGDDRAAELALPGAGHLAGGSAVGAGDGGVVAGGRICQNAGLADKGQKVVHEAIPVGVAL